MVLVAVSSTHKVGSAGFVTPKIGGVRDQICIKQNPQVDCVMRLDF